MIDMPWLDYPGTADDGSDFDYVTREMAEADRLAHTEPPPEPEEPEPPDCADPFCSAVACPVHGEDPSYG